MSEEMSVNDALTVAQRLKNHFQAFARLEDFLKYIAGCQASLVDLESNLKHLNAKVEATENHLAMVTEDVGSKLVDLNNRLANAKYAHNEGLKDIVVQEAAKRSELEYSIINHNRDLTDVKKSFSDSLASEKEKFDKEIASLTETRDALKEEVKSLKQVVASVRSSLSPPAEE